MKIRVIDNIFEREKAREIDVPYEYRPLSDYFGALGLEDDEGTPLEREWFSVILSGRRAAWDEIPCADDEAVFVQDVLGPVAAAIGALYTTVSTYLAAHSAVAFIASTLASTLVGYGMSYLFSSLAATTDSSLEATATYGWDGVENVVGEGNIVPVAYGRNKVGGVIVEAFIAEEYSGAVYDEEHLHALVAVSEGPIEWIWGDTIELNGQPLGEFEGVSHDIRLGTNDQTPMMNFSQVVRHFTLSGVQLKYANSPWEYTLNGDAVDRCAVTLSSPAFYWTNAKGGTSEMTVDFNAWYAPVGSDDWTWVGGGGPWNNWRMYGKSTSALSYTIAFAFPHAGRWKVRIERCTEDHDDSTWQMSKTYVNDVKEIENQGLAYPGTALLGLRLKATDSLSGSMPTITSIMLGRKLYDVRTGVFAYSNNPANVIYDLMTNRRYGLGGRYGVSEEEVRNPHVDGLAPKYIDMDSLRRFADYCDETVRYSYYDPTDPASVDGWVEVEEKRFELNLVIDRQVRAQELINKIAGSCRALAYWAGNKLKIAVEMESRPVQLFNMGNIVRDSYSEDYIGLPDIPNMVECSIVDEDDDFEKVTITGVDASRLDEGTNSREINLYGLTKLSRAHREVAYAMAKARSIRKSITFQAGLEAIVCEVGDVFLFQHNIPKYGLAGGQVTAVSGGTVTLDRSFHATAGKEYVLRVRRNADNAQLVYTFRPAATGKTRTVTLGANDDASLIGPQDLYAVGEGLNVATGTVADLSASVVTLDCEVSLVKGKQYSIRVYDSTGAPSVHVFTAEETGLFSSFRLNPADAIPWGPGCGYVFGEMTREAWPFRVTSMTRKSDNRIEIAAEEYVHSVFAQDHTIAVSRKGAANALLGETEVYDVDPDTGEANLVRKNTVRRKTSGRMPPYVTEVSLKERVEPLGDIYVPAIEVSFRPVRMPANTKARIKRYDVYVSTNGGLSWTLHGSVDRGGHGYTIEGVRAGRTYHVLVKPVTTRNVTNDHELRPDALGCSITLTGDDALERIDPPTGLAATPTPFAVNLKWDNPDVSNLSHVEVWCAVNQNDRTAATRIGTKARGESFSHTNLDPDSTYYYWVRAVSSTGKKSRFEPGGEPEPAPGFTPGLPAALLDFDGGTF